MLDVKRLELVNDSSNHTTNVTTKQETTDNSLKNVPFELIRFGLNLLTHQFKLLTVFILITLWFTNNQSKINFIRAKLSDEEVLRSAHMNREKKRFLLKGFAIGMLFIILAIVTVLFSENETLRWCSTIIIQIIVSIISLAGLVIRRRKKYLNPKYQINVLKHHFIIFFTMFATYVMCFINIVVLMQLSWWDHSTSKSSLTANQMLSMIAWITMLVQVTVQTYLLRLQGKKLVDMSHIFALLVTTNLSLWIIELGTEVNRSIQPIPTNHSNQLPFAHISHSIHRILTMFVTLNRYYCALIFVHFWKMRI